MINQSMVAIWGGIFFIMLIGFIVAIGFLIYASIELRKSAAAFKEFLKAMEGRIAPVLEESEQTLRSLRKVSDDVGTATDNVRNFSGAIYDIVANVRALSGIVSGFREDLSLRKSALGAGAKAALEVLITQIKQRRF